MMVSDSEKSANKSFSLRMKSTLTKRGVHVKTSGYRVIHVLGTLRPQSAYGLSRSGAQNNCSNANTNTSSGNSNISETLQLLGFVGMAIALPPPTITELRLELDTFITKLSPDFKVIYCEPIISDLMDLSIEDVTDRLLYDLCHAADLQSLRRSHLDILNKGQALTDYYRLMNRHGGFVWIQTCATTLLNNKNADDQSILAINFVVSSVDSNNCPIDLWQLTGDVTSSMSSSSNSQSRQEKLKELRTKKPSVTASTRSKTNSPSIQTGALSPSTLPGESSKAECKTPGAVSPKLPADHSGEDTEEPSPGKISGNVDHKNKRRKMENPKKRKRSNCDPQGIEHEDKALNLTRSGAKTTVISRTPHNVNSDYQNLEKSVGDRRVITSGLSLHTDSVTSSSPEDLSIKRSVRPSNDRNIIQHSSKAFKITNSPATDKLKAGSFLNVSDSHSPNQLCITGSSVKELEAAMNRHLPASSSTVFPSQNERHSFDNVLMDPSGAIKGFSGFPSSGTATNPQHSSTPWIPSSRGSESEMLTASNFLRSLYASRESVIKTNSRSQTSFLNSDPPTSLLTPPEPDPATYRDPNNPYLYGKSEFSGHGHIYDKESELDVRDHLYKEQTNRDQFTFIQYKDHIPSAYMDHISSAVYKDHITSTYKELSPYKDIIPAFTIPSLMSPTGRMHQAYPSFHHHFTVPITSTSMDACSITPPSSNSPDLNKHLSASQQFNTTSYSTDLANACNLSQKQNIISSVSPSASSTAIHSHHYHHSRHHKDNFYQGVSSVEAAKSGYYGVSTSSTGAMYTELNQNSSGSTQYETCTRPVLPWY